MRRNAGDALFVRPLCWTDLHSRLLGIRFVKRPADDIPQVAQGSHKASPRAHRLCEELTRLETPERMFATNPIRQVMEMLYPGSRLTSHPARGAVDLPLHFGGRTYPNACRLQLAWDCVPAGDGDTAESFRTVSTCPIDPTPPSMPTASQQQQQQQQPAAAAQRHPTVAYMSKRYIFHSRAAMFRVAPMPGGNLNVPVENLCTLRLDRLLPSVEGEEAFFAAVFLAMAQTRFYPTVWPFWRRNPALRTPPSSPDTAPEFHDVKVHLITHDEDAGGCFVVYTAVVTAAFLQRFHEPAKTPRACGGAEGGDALDLGMQIEYTRVPFWPVLGLKERLGRALGKDLVGEFDERQIDMLGSRKRKRTDVSSKREVLGERVNESFGDQHDDETSSEGPVADDGPNNKVTQRREGPPTTRPDEATDEEGDTEPPTPPKKARREGPRYDAETSWSGEVAASISS